MNPDKPGTLPGIELPKPDSTPIENAARQTIEELHSVGLLEPRHALSVQLVLDLARSVGHGLVAARVSVATATLARQLLDAIETLPTPPPPVSDAWAVLEDQLAEAAAESAEASR